jgi:peptidoglycan hydrolase-like protein with peptidoglycan-binding domain
VQIGSTASTSYYDTGLATSTTYDYAVIAHDAANNLAPQTSVGVTTLAHMPSAPTSTPAATTSLPTMTSYVPPTAVEPQPIVTTPISPTLPTNSITTNLSYGSRGFVVINLQNFLVNQNYLPSIDATGFYGSLTQKAVQSYQCAQRIVCSGSPSTTGWGRVGAKTRAAINATL